MQPETRPAESSATSPPRSRCPRCGVAIVGEQKFCSNCAFRLRPDLVDSYAAAERPSAAGPRVLALGGYLAFASLLLLLALVGIRLFGEATPSEPVPASEQLVLNPRDLDSVPLDRTGFVPVEAGRFYWKASDANYSLPPPEEFALDDPFEIAAREVTNDQYFAFLLDVARESEEPVPARRIPAGWIRPIANRKIPRIYERRQGNHPVTGIDFYVALEFCQWLWKTEFRGDPNVTVDLPTCFEFVRAGRGDSLEGVPAKGEANYSGVLEPVTSPKAGRIRGLSGLLGNAAEWVHGPDVYGTAAGGSYGDLGEFDSPGNTPFGPDGFDVSASLKTGHETVGFRVVVRRTPELPTFVRVDSGPVRYGPTPDDPEWAARVAAKLREDGNDETDLDAFHVRPTGEGATIDQPFEIARAEVSNRQYLAFLVEVAELSPSERVPELRPGSFDREHPGEWNPELGGLLGPFKKVPYVFRAGEENQPVRGVSLEQAKAYADWLTRRLKDPRRRCALPTVAQHVRAGRGDRTDPYPWGADVYDRGLICHGRAIEQGRPFSLLGRLGPDAPPIVGICANVMEYVFDESGRRWLLAGGCYDLPDRYCTLDSFLPAGDTTRPVLLPEPEEEADEEAARREDWLFWQPVMIYRGFRVVRMGS